MYTKESAEIDGSPMQILVFAPEGGGPFPGPLRAGGAARRARRGPGPSLNADRPPPLHLALFVAIMAIRGTASRTWAALVKGRPARLM